MVNRKIVIFSYYSPEELTGIGKYNGDMIEWFLKNGMEVISFSSAPFYPKWSLYEGHRNKLYEKKCTDNLTDIRSWVFIPKNPGSIKKIISELSFILTSGISFLLNRRLVKGSSLFVVISPPFFLPIVPLILSKAYGVPILNHIQDLQVDAAKELRLLPANLCHVLEFFERLILRNCSNISTISLGMKAKLERKNLSSEVLVLPNWSDLDRIYPSGQENWLHARLGLSSDKKLVVYSGNIGEKQGLEIIIQVAKMLKNHPELHFVILGEGLYKNQLITQINTEQLRNLTISGLVPREFLNNMLNDSFIQLVIQKSIAADSFLPSKLTNILAAGAVSIVTAEPGTSLHDILVDDGCACVINPDSPTDLKDAILVIFEDFLYREELKRSARRWALKNLHIDNCLAPLIPLLKANVD